MNDIRYVDVDKKDMIIFASRSIRIIENLTFLYYTKKEMNCFHKKTILFISISWLMLVFVECKDVKAPNKNSIKLTERQYYNVPKTPSIITDTTEIMLYNAQNFWRDFDFSDSTQVSICDSIYFSKLVSNWIALLKSVPEIGAKCVENIMSKIQVCKGTFDIFVRTTEKILFDPNSPLRDEELYLPILKVQIESSYTDYAERERCRHRLELLCQNRIGQIANDFEYTLADGHKETLYNNIKSEYTLIFIYDPDCNVCSSLRQELSNSNFLSILVNTDRLIILAIYPYEDTNEWFRHLDEIPQTWINGYDKECNMHSQRLYDVSALPSLYLLDKNKIVLIKDGSNVSEIEAKLNRLIYQPTGTSSD